MKRPAKNRFERLKADLAANGKLRCRLITGSMAPLMPVGEIIEVAPLRGDIAPFDILVFMTDERLTCHYVVHANRLKDHDPVIVTRGLASGHEDIPIRRSAVLGRVVSHRVPLAAKLAAVSKGILRRIRSF